MTYELAKKLKESGFKQGNVNGQECDEFIQQCYKPTLSELIEACGDRFDFLSNNRNGNWQASGENVPDQLGKTPSEAVANLWLELNKKMVKLDDIYKNPDNRPFLSDTKSAANIDDAIMFAAQKGYSEIIVDKEEMLLILRVYLAGAPNAPENGEILRSGKLDKFMGIKLIQI